MKVALVILHADPAKGGAEGYTVNLAGSLKARGYDVALLATSFAESARVVQNVPLDNTGLTRLGRYRSFIDSLDRHLRENRYDIVHAITPVRRCDFYHPQAGLAAEALASGHLKYRGFRRPLDKLATRLNRKRQFVAGVERDMLLSPDSRTTVLCVSDLVKETARRHYALPEGRLVTLFNAINSKFFDPIINPGVRNEVRAKHGLGDQVVALIVAQDFRRKGVRPAIEALARVPDERLSLLVVGKPNPAEYRALAKSLNVEHRVIFAGPTTYTYAFYQAADFFVLPTYHDPCSLVVLEALAMGLPTITTRQNGAFEIMAEGEHGYVLSSSDDIESLAQAMRDMLDLERRQAMRRACLALRPRLSWEAHLDQLRDLYQGVVERSGR